LTGSAAQANSQSPGEAETLHMERALVAGGWVGAPDRIVVADPATGESIGSVPRLGRAHVAKAVEAPRLAAPAWRSRMPRQQGRFASRDR